LFRINLTLIILASCASLSRIYEPDASGDNQQENLPKQPRYHKR